MVLWTWKKLWILLFAVPMLTACPTPASFTLNPKEASPGSLITASLTNLNGSNASVKVANISATVTAATQTSLSFTVPVDAPLGNQEVVIVASNNTARGTLNIIASALRLDRERASKAEVVTGSVTGTVLTDITLNLAGIPVAANKLSETSFTFTVPENAPAGDQSVVLTSGDFSASQTLGVMSEVESNTASVLFKASTNEEALRASLASLGYGLEGSLKPLGLSEGPCAAELATITVGNTPLGQALEELKALEQNGDVVSLYVDPRGTWAFDSINHVEAVGGTKVHERGLKGKGSLIAVLDTGVNAHPELGSRFRSDLSYDVVNDDAVPEDAFNQPGTDLSLIEGHGTPIAVLAAGSTYGIAPEAEIMGVKTCQDDGSCLSSDVILGMCHALSNAPDISKLIINLSLGGDTPITALEAILSYALDQGVLIAAAGGNQGEVGSPIHYPAAFPLDGLVAVTALEAEALPCISFESLPAGAGYTLGNSFSDAGFDVDVTDFFFSSGAVSTGGSVGVTSGDGFGGSGQAVFVSNVSLTPNFGQNLGGLSLLFNDGGGNENLNINGVLRNLPQLADIAGENIAGVKASIETGQTTTLRLEGSIESFSIGGQELSLDDICPILGQGANWQPASFSTRGAYIDIAAPGVGLSSGTPAGGIFTGYEGTSFATPLVAGGLALWREAQPASSSSDIETLIKATAQTLIDPSSNLPFDTDAVGEGILDLSQKP